MNNELFKLNTRRYLAWGFVAVAGGVGAFLAVWGAVSGQVELATLAAGALFTELGVIVGAYFTKKTSEE